MTEKRGRGKRRKEQRAIDNDDREKSARKKRPKIAPRGQVWKQYACLCVVMCVSVCFCPNCFVRVCSGNSISHLRPSVSYPSITRFSFLTIVESNTHNTGGGTGGDIVTTAALARSPALVGRDGGNSRAGGRVAGVEGEDGDISQVDGLEPLLDLRGVGWGDSVDRRELCGVEGGRCGGGGHQGDGDGRKNGLHGYCFFLCEWKLFVFGLS